MDNYPQHLAPEFEKNGAVKTPFEEWWPRVKRHFPKVPDEVAQEWLHRHWGQSPFRWVQSNIYTFGLEKMPSSCLTSIRSSWSEFKKDNSPALNQGKYICGDHPDRPWGTDPIWLATYMRENCNFPTPIIVLDNTDDHLSDTNYYKDIRMPYPQNLVLIEGHTRFNIGLHLQSIGKLDKHIFIYRLHLE